MVKLRTRISSLPVPAVLALVMGAVASAGAQQALTEQSVTLFTNVRIFDGRSPKLSPPSNVLVRGNRIERISLQPIPTDRRADTAVIDGAGRTLMPGLIDNHVHIFVSAGTQEELIDPKATFEELNRKAAAEAKRMLLRGFTTARDMGGPMFEIKRAADAGNTLGPRIYPSGAMISQTSGHGDSRHPHERSRRFFGTVSKGEELGVSFIADGRDEVLTATRENLRSGASQIKVMAGGGAASAYDPLDVTQYTLDEMKAAVEAAEDWGTYVTVHAYTPRAVQRAVEAGVKCIEHGQLLDEATIKLLARKGVWLSLQSLDEAPPSAPEHVREKKHTVVQGTDDAFKWAKQHKVKLAWGTDFLFNPDQNENQNAEILKLQQWFRNAEILRLITHDNAQLLALSGPRNPYPGKLGVVEEGALADLLLVAGDPIADLEILADPEKNLVVIMKDGKVYKDAQK